MSSTKAWASGRPVYGQFPRSSGDFQGNPIVDAVTQPWDALIMEAKQEIDDFYKNYVDPETARVEALDSYTRFVYGFTDGYWDHGWSELIKRQLLKDAHSKIWANKGTLWLLEYLLDLFSIEAEVSIVGAFLLDTNVLGDRMGGEYLSYKILVHPLLYLDTGKEWKTITWIISKFMPAWCESVVLHSYFALDFSRLDRDILG